MESAEGLKTVESFRLDDEDFPLNGGLSDSMRPIHFNVGVSKTDARIVADNISAITQFLERKYKNAFEGDQYLVLMEMFRFLLLKKKAIFQLYGLVEDGDKAVQGVSVRVVSLTLKHADFRWSLFRTATSRATSAATGAATATAAPTRAASAGSSFESPCASAPTCR
jgi:hypothetical protein